jgi:hypothetical protein
MCYGGRRKNIQLVERFGGWKMVKCGQVDRADLLIYLWEALRISAR